MDKNAFLNPSKIKTIAVPLPSGDTVYVRKISQGDTEHLTEKYFREGKESAGMRFVVNKVLCDENGMRVFEDKDLDAMKVMDVDDIKAIAEAATAFSGMNKKTDEKKP